MKYKGLHYTGTPTNIHIVLNTQKIPLLNQATQKNTCQIFLPKKIPETKISNPKKSFDYPCHLKFRVPSPHPPGPKLWKDASQPWNKMEQYRMLIQ